MTKRILELKKQAEDYVDGVDDGLSIEHYRQFVDLKFAMLIIEECISACATDRLGKTVGAEELIKQHFGVGE